jgi:hypothetical protein
MKYKGDNEGYKRGALGKFDPPNKLNRGPTSWDQPTLSDGDEGLAVADKAAKYTRNEDAGLRNKLPDDATAKSRDIYSDVCKNSLDDDAGGSRPGPIKYGVD